MLNDYSQDFVAQAKCKEKALNQIAQGSVVEFQVAGQCGLGVLDAARSKKVFGIGVDADQFYLGPHVMTSALKKVDVAVYTAITGAKNGTAEGRHQRHLRRQGRTASATASGARRCPLSIKRQGRAQYELLKAGKIKGIPSTVK